MRVLLLVATLLLVLTSVLAAPTPYQPAPGPGVPYRKLPAFPPPAPRPARKRPAPWSAPYGFGWTWPPRLPSAAPAFVKIMRSGERVPVLDGEEERERDEERKMVGVMVDVTIVEE